MIRFIIAISIFVILNAIFGSMGSWYIIVFFAFLAGIILQRNALMAFVSGFIVGFLIWYFKLQAFSESDLTSRMAELMGARGPFQLVILSSAIGGFLSAFGMLSGNLLNKPRSKDEE
jgi:hypothetical protein